MQPHTAPFESTIVLTHLLSGAMRASKLPFGETRVPRQPSAYTLNKLEILKPNPQVSLHSADSCMIDMRFRPQLRVFCAVQVGFWVWGWLRVSGLGVG